MAENIGVIIESGASDWQIFQQNARGTADITVAGRVIPPPNVKPMGVNVRIVCEDTNAPPASHLDWKTTKLGASGKWSFTLKNVPAGGLYRIETAVYDKANPALEWHPRGDIRHCVGVGDLWVITGQSNSAGYGRGPIHDPPELGLHVFNNAMRWALATQPMNESTDTAHPENREQANPGHSAWLHFARLLRRSLNHPIGLIQTSLGGSPLVSWNPTEPASGGHPLFDNMVRCVKACGGTAKGVLWYQGESDCGLPTAKTYEKRFTAAVKAWRKALKNPKLTVCTVQLNRVFGPQTDDSNRGWTIVREAQRQVVRKVLGVTVTATLDLGLTDAIHTSPSGNMDLAVRTANAALAVAYGKDIAYRAAEPKSAKRTDGGKVVAVAFDFVTSRIDHTNIQAQPFQIEDKAGVVPIEKIEYTASSTIRLHLSRAVEGNAVLHGGWGASPALMPYDLVRVMPALGFYGVKIG